MKIRRDFIGLNVMVSRVNNMDVHYSQALTVPTLLNSSVTTLVLNLSKCNYDVHGLPVHIQEKCLTLLCKRGLVTDELLEKFLHKQVQKLDLSESDVSDMCLRKLVKCPNLKKIDLNSLKGSRIGITTLGIINLSENCNSLQVLYLRRCVNINDEAIIAISHNCPNMRDLNIGGCTNITDSSLTALAQHSSYLQSINLGRTNITDNGILNLCKGNCAKTLKEIHIGHCQLVTDESVEAICIFCPLISILIFHGCPLITEQARLALEDITISGQSRMKQVTWTIY